jgi:hypothetical protein
MAPSPKSQDHEVGLPVETLLKVTVWPVVGTLGEKPKAATGEATVTVRVLVAVLEPRALRTVRVTV